MIIVACLALKAFCSAHDFNINSKVPNLMIARYK